MIQGVIRRHPAGSVVHRNDLPDTVTLSVMWTVVLKPHVLKTIRVQESLRSFFGRKQT